MGGIVTNKSIANTLINNKLTSMAASSAPTPISSRRRSVPAG
jgi:hypothetical protein